MSNMDQASGSVALILDSHETLKAQPRVTGKMSLMPRITCAPKFGQEIHITRIDRQLTDEPGAKSQQ